MLKSVAAAAAVLAVAVGVAFWAYAEGDDSAEADVHEVRWGNVTVQVSEGSDVIVAPDYSLSKEAQPVLVVKKGDSFVELDADTGAVVEESVADADRAVIDQVLATLKVKEFDEKAAPWPYGSARPSRQREQIGNITYIPPDPASGIVVQTGIADYFDSRGSMLYIRIANSRSTMFVDSKTGLVVVDEDGTRVAAEDEKAFQRFLSAVKYLEVRNFAH